MKQHIQEKEQRDEEVIILIFFLEIVFLWHISACRNEGEIC